MCKISPRHCGILDLGEEEGWHERALLSQIFVALIAELATKSCRHIAMPRAHCVLVAGVCSL